MVGSLPSLCFRFGQSANQDVARKVRSATEDLSVGSSNTMSYHPYKLSPLPNIMDVCITCHPPATAEATLAAAGRMPPPSPILQHLKEAEAGPDARLLQMTCLERPLHSFLQCSILLVRVQIEAHFQKSPKWIPCLSNRLVLAVFERWV